MKHLLILIVASIILFTACTKKDEEKMNFIDKQTIIKTIKALETKFGTQSIERFKLSVPQAASFWTKEDGSKKDFIQFCLDNFVNTQDSLNKVFMRLSRNFESIYGLNNKLIVELNWPLQVVGDEELAIDSFFGGYDPTANLSNDFYKNKIAFYVILNFPFYSLEQKQEFGSKWTRKEWAYARMGDIFTSRVPSDVLQKIAEASSKAELYITKYNIHVGYLVDDKGNTFFDKEKKLITHWNLRDEIKSQYSNPDGLVRQNMIYEVMKRIITQTIPSQVISSSDYTWDPYKNKVFKSGKEVSSTPEPNTRYEFLLNNFKARQAMDKYCPSYPTYIDRAFSQGLEIPQKQVEDLFVKLVSSPTVLKIGELIKRRLGRDLQPFDIWYDGFKARSTMTDENLSERTRSKYPNAEAFATDMSTILTKLGFSSTKANEIASKVQVDPSRGAGHAIGAQMKTDKAHLRTRVSDLGMDYKGYNIAVHEFGHNTEQTITLHDVDYFMMSGVPNTAFTEAIAFLFQKRDLDLLGIKNDDSNKDLMMALDNFWSAYEIMGVSLVDMNLWKWLYAHPDCTVEELKNETISIAKDIWNKYYAPVFGVKDQPLLAIYSHMIEYPLYLSAYPVGHLIEFQIDQYSKGKVFADEITKMLVQGRLIPQIWMKGAVGKEISVEATINATEDALKIIKN